MANEAWQVAGVLIAAAAFLFTVITYLRRRRRPPRLIFVYKETDHGRVPYSNAEAIGSDGTVQPADYRGIIPVHEHWQGEISIRDAATQKEIAVAQLDTHGRGTLRVRVGDRP